MFIVYSIIKQIFLHYFIPYSGNSGGGKKNLPANANRHNRFPRLERYPGGGHNNSLQCSSLENYKDRGAWWGIENRVTKR